MPVTLESEEPLSNQSVVKVLTNKSFARMVEEGGIGDWRGDASRLARMEYVVCTRNARAPDSPHDVPHGSAFLVGKIVGVMAVGDGRVRIVINEYADDVVEDFVWRGSKNPVRYLDKPSAERQLKRKLDELEFKPFPKHSGGHATGACGSSNGGLTIPQAKAGLAKTLGIDESKIEILIKS
jgi:hypothetical protein